ncbi:Nitrogen assimilation transcription factor nirA [Colletotrichum fructicola]|nr:Nitrogen assimilation transcription factor nirA [Colletotrichum fructicola]
MFSQSGIKNLQNTTRTQDPQSALCSPPDTSSLDYPHADLMDKVSSVRDLSGDEHSEQRTPISHHEVHEDDDDDRRESPSDLFNADETENIDPQLGNSTESGSPVPLDAHTAANPPVPETISQRRPEPDIEEVTQNLDVDSSPGQVRYYGPTTQLHIQSLPANNLGDGPVHADTGPMSSFSVDMDSLQLRDMLLKSYWSFSSRSVPVVDESLFMAHRASGQRSQYFSPFLEAAMLACATRIRTSTSVRKLGRAYADLAKKGIVFELERPTIATLQGFLLLSDFEATSARDRIGWTYNGIACRLIFDLGLHEDCSRLIRHGILVQADADLRVSLFLSAFVYDRLWALYLGRPSCVPMNCLEQRRPQVASAKSTGPLEHWVALCKYISEVTEKLNGFGPPLDHTCVDSLLDLSARISAAHDRLPPGLSSKQTSELCVTAYGLNIQYHGIQIVLHRTLVKVLLQHNSSKADGLDRDEQIKSFRRILYDNAVCICRLLLTYREMFGVENFITVMLDNMYIAASTLVSHILQPPIMCEQDGSYCEASRLLGFLTETMRDLPKYYPVVEKMRQTLSSITENTILAGSFGSMNLSNGPQNLDSHSVMANTVAQPVSGSWGSMGALVHDDFLLGQGNLLGDGFSPDPRLSDNLWFPDVTVGLLQ